MRRLIWNLIGFTALTALNIAVSVGRPNPATVIAIISTIVATLVTAASVLLVRRNASPRSLELFQVIMYAGSGGLVSGIIGMFISAA